MDADLPKKVESKPAAMERQDKEFQKRLQQYHEAPKIKPKTLKITDYGPIASMVLGSDWKDVGGGSSNPRYRFHSYKLVDGDAVLRVNSTPLPRSDSTAKAVASLVDRTDGPVSPSDYEPLRIFGTAGNPKLYTIESVEVVDLGGKKVIAMTGQLKQTGSREKNIYVSLSGNWTNNHEFGIAGSADRKEFDKQVAVFDKALQTILWRAADIKEPLVGK